MPPMLALTSSWSLSIIFAVSELLFAVRSLSPTKRQTIKPHRFPPQWNDNSLRVHSRATPQFRERVAPLLYVLAGNLLHLL